MDVQTIEFTVEQLLDLHRYWITELFLVDKKSEEEIINLLHHNQINVTCVQYNIHHYSSSTNDVFVVRILFILTSQIGIYSLRVRIY